MLTLIIGFSFLLLGILPCGGLTFWLFKEFDESDLDRGEQKI